MFGTFVYSEVDFACMGAMFWYNEKYPTHLDATNSNIALRRYKGLFGCSPLTTSQLWGLLLVDGYLATLSDSNHHPIHLLWALFFLKQYHTEEVSAAMCHCCEKTHRKWVWIFVQAIAELKLIRWENRNYRHNPIACCRVSVDGTDFEIEEPQPFNKKWFSHKFRGPGVRYEVAVAIATGWIVWVSGPHPCGSFSDLKIARLPGGIIASLDAGEMFIADSGYRNGGFYSLTPTGINDADQRLQQEVRARHKNINGKFKEWRCLSSVFRHDHKHLHYPVFMSVANITQLELLNQPIYSLW